MFSRSLLAEVGIWCLCVCVCFCSFGIPRRLVCLLPLVFPGDWCACFLWYSQETGRVGSFGIPRRLVTTEFVCVVGCSGIPRDVDGSALMLSP